MNNQQPDAAAVECVNEISHMTWDSSATFQARLVPILSRYLKQAREQGTHAQQVRECAEKAVMALAKAGYIPKNIFVDEPAAIICEAFGAPVDEYEQALAEAWRARLALGNAPHFVDFRDGFHAAWKLAKGKP